MRGSFHAQVVDDPTNKSRRDLGANEAEYGIFGQAPPPDENVAHPCTVFQWKVCPRKRAIHACLVRAIHRSFSPCNGWDVELATICTDALLRKIKA